MDALEPTPFRLLIDRVVPRARPHFWAAFPITAAPVVIASVAMIFMQHRMMSTLIAADPSALLFVGGFVLSLFIASLAFGLTYSALGIAAMATFDGSPIEMGQAWRLMLRPKALGTLILWAAAGLLSLMLCVVPALIVSPLLALTLNVMVAEQRYGLDALKRSASLVWWSPTGRPIDSPFLRVAAMVFIGWGVQWGVGLIVQGPFAIAQQYYVLRDAAGGVNDPFAAAMGPMWIQIGSQFFGALATAISWFYWAFGFSMLYFELRRRREATDLRAAIHELTGTPAARPDATPDSLLAPSTP